MSEFRAFSSEVGPVRVKKTRQIKNLEPRFDSIETEKALARIATRELIKGQGSGYHVSGTRRTASGWSRRESGDSRLALQLVNTGAAFRCCRGFIKSKCIRCTVRAAAFCTYMTAR